MINITKDFRCQSNESVEELVQEHKPAKVIQGTLEGGLVSGIYKSRTIKQEQPEYPVQKTSPFEYDRTDGA